jgi:hypothetical protein
MAIFGAAPDDGGIDALLDSSPEPGVHTSAAAETGFLLALVALASAPFSVTHGVTLAAGLVALVLGAVGVVTTSNPYVAGRGLVPLSLALAFVALLVVGLRYLGLDTAFGDGWLPTLTDWLERLNGRVGT